MTLPIFPEQQFSWAVMPPLHHQNQIGLRRQSLNSKAWTELDFACCSKIHVLLTDTEGEWRKPDWYSGSRKFWTKLVRLIVFLLVYQNQVCIPLFPILHPNVKIDISLVQTSRHPLECVRDRVDTNFDDLEEWKIIQFSF